MAEEEKVADEGLGDFENILGDAEGGGLEDSGIGGDLDDIFGDEGGGGEAPLGEGGDSDLDNFFEDLSTIDDLELHDEEAPAEEAVEDVVVSAPEPEEAIVEEAPKKEKPKKEKKPRVKKEPGFISKSVRWLILLAIIVGGGYYIYQFFFPEFPMPWKAVQEEKDRLIGMLEDLQKDKPQVPPPPRDEPPKVTEKPPGKPPPAVKAAKPSVRPPKKPARRPAVERGPWSIQVASCFFPSCLDSHRSFLKATGRSVLLRKQNAKSEMLEIYSSSVVSTRERAQIIADRINRNHPLEGHAYVYSEGSGYRISMGAFGDLSRAKVVKNALNEKFFGDVNFNTRLKAFPYRVNKVLTGKYPSRKAANQALAKLRIVEPRFKGAFIVRNR